MNKNALKIFWGGFQIGCRQMIRHPGWLAAHIFLFILCLVQNILVAPIVLIAIAIWALGYHQILLAYPDEE